MSVQTSSRTPLLASLDDSSTRCSTTMSFLVLLLSLSLHFFNYSICFPVIVFYVIDVVSDENHYNISSSHPCSNSTHHHQEMELQKKVTEIMTPNPFISFFPGLVPTLLLGPLLDRLGRKIGFLIPMAGTLVKQIIYLVVIWKRLPVRILFIGNGIEGLTGGFAAMLMAAFGMVADLTLPGKDRTLRISVAEATQSIATSLGGFATGFGIKYLRFLDCVLIALGLNVVNIILTVALLPETLHVRIRTPCFAIMTNIKRCFSFYCQDTEDRRQLTLVLGMVAFIFTVAVNFSKPGIMSMFLIKPNLCWDQEKINTVMAVRVVVCWLIILACMPVFQKVLGMEDRTIGIVGCVSSILACFIMSFATYDKIVYAVLGTGVFMRLTIPMLRSIMSGSVRQDEQGALYAGMGCVEMVCAAVMGTLTILLYRATDASYPDTTFLVMASIMAGVLIIFIILNLTSRPSYASLHGYTRLDGNDSDNRDVN
ncbi:proton-coupled folate transporter-like [Haliotis rufescens]|uniref:proton-coupled folate transporter-like n=1 Tax=Haliotis rufescens TaxID=6454 RepID=UPI00201EE929|nr:proton-coupled folate transporter-like [Haliotis rufescens]